VKRSTGHWALGNLHYARDRATKLGPFAAKALLLEHGDVGPRTPSTRTSTVGWIRAHIASCYLGHWQQGATEMHDPVPYRQIRGSCHCGNIRVTFDRPKSEPAIPARACGCGLCTKHRAAWTSHPDGRFHLRIADESRVTQYRFGTKTADFHVCLTCGAIPIVTCMIDGIRYAVFNVNTFDDVDRSELVETATNFDAETTENRLARRRRNWTPEADHGEGGD
jgi:hypothetical protein